MTEVIPEVSKGYGHVYRVRRMSDGTEVRINERELIAVSDEIWEADIMELAHSDYPNIHWKRGSEELP